MGNKPSNNLNKLKFSKNKHIPQNVFNLAVNANTFNQFTEYNIYRNPLPNHAATDYEYTYNQAISEAYISQIERDINNIIPQCIYQLIYNFISLMIHIHHRYQKQVIYAKPDHLKSTECDFNVAIGFLLDHTY